MRQSHVGTESRHCQAPTRPSEPFRQFAGQAQQMWRGDGLSDASKHTATSLESVAVSGAWEPNNTTRDGWKPATTRSTMVDMSVSVPITFPNALSKNCRIPPSPSHNKTN